MASSSMHALAVSRLAGCGAAAPRHCMVAALPGARARSTTRSGCRASSSCRASPARATGKAGVRFAAMKILISVDMEGISGVVSRRETATGWPHGAPKGNDYERARVWMTDDANAAIRGAFDGGATEVLVADAHDGMLNLVWEELDPRAELIRGYENRTCGMSAGLDAGSAFDGLFFVGYHA